MNMKTTKFLAVLAVLAMAFAAFAVIAPTVENDAGTATTEAVTTGSTIEDAGDYYVSTSVSTLTINASGKAVNLYIQSGHSSGVTLTITAVGTLMVYATTATEEGEIEYLDDVALHLKAADTGAKITTGALTDTDSEWIGSSIAPTGSSTTYTMGTYGNSVYSYYPAVLAETYVPDTAITKLLFKSADISIVNNATATSVTKQLDLDGFTGEITCSSSNFTAIAAWTSGNLEIVKGTDYTTAGFTTTGDLTIDNGATLSATGALVFNGALYLYGTLTTTGDVTIAGAFSNVDSNSNKGVLTLNGSSQTLSIDSSITYNGELTLTGATTPTIDIDDDATFTITNTKTGLTASTKAIGINAAALTVTGGTLSITVSGKGATPTGLVLNAIGIYATGVLAITSNLSITATGTSTADSYVYGAGIYQSGTSGMTFGASTAPTTLPVMTITGNDRGIYAGDADAITIQYATLTATGGEKGIKTNGVLTVSNATVNANISTGKANGAGIDAIAGIYVASFAISGASTVNAESVYVTAASTISDTSKLVVKKDVNALLVNGIVKTAGSSSPSCAWDRGMYGLVAATIGSSGADTPTPSTTMAATDVYAATLITVTLSGSATLEVEPGCGIIADIKSGSNDINFAYSTAVSGDQTTATNADGSIYTIPMTVGAGSNLIFGVGSVIMSGYVIIGDAGSDYTLTEGVLTVTGAIEIYGELDVDIAMDTTSGASILVPAGETLTLDGITITGNAANSIKILGEVSGSATATSTIVTTATNPKSASDVISGPTITEDADMAFYTLTGTAATDTANINYLVTKYAYVGIYANNKTFTVGGADLVIPKGVTLYLGVAAVTSGGTDISSTLPATATAYAATTSAITASSAVTITVPVVTVGTTTTTYEMEVTGAKVYDVSEYLTSKIDVYGTLSLDAADVCTIVKIETDGYVSVKNPLKLNATGTPTSDLKVGYGNTLTMDSVTVSSGKTVYSYGNLVIEGTNTVQYGGKLVTYSGSTATVNGILSVEGTVETAGYTGVVGSVTIYRAAGSASWTNTGYITVYSDASFDVTKGKQSGANANTFTSNVAYGFTLYGTSTITGTFAGQMIDYGTLTFNGTSSSATVYLRNEVSLNLVSVEGTLTVNDYDAACDDTRDADTLAYKSYVLVYDGNSFAFTNVKGIVVTETVKVTAGSITVSEVDIPVKYYVSTLDITGTSASAAKDVDNTITAAGGSVKTTTYKSYWSSSVSKGSAAVGDLTLGKKSELVFSGSNNITVPGTVTVLAVDARIQWSNSDLNVTVTGAICANDDNGYRLIPGNYTMILSDNTTEAITGFSGKVNATYYYYDDETGNTNYVLTSFSAALEEILSADEQTIYVYGSQSISADATIPDKGNVVEDSSGTISIGKKATVTISEDAVVDASAGVLKVVGVLVVMDKDTGLKYSTNTDNFVYQVKTENGNVVTYAGIEGALARSVSGDVITMSQSGTISSDAIIPEGVQLIVPAKIELSLGSKTKEITLTVNGQLQILRNGEISKVASSKDVNIVVNGSILLDNAAINDDADEFEMTNYVTFEMKVDGRATDVLSNLTFAAENCTYGKVTVYGAVSADEIEFTPAADEEIFIWIPESDDTDSINAMAVSELTLNGKTTLDVDLALLYNNGVFNGTVVSGSILGNSSILFVDATGFIIQANTVETAAGDVDHTYLFAPYFDGRIAIMSGTVEIDTFTIDGVAVASYGLVINDDTTTASLYVAEDAYVQVATGSYLTIVAASDENYEEPMAVIDGTVSVLGTMYVDGYTVVKGELYVVKEKSTGQGEVLVTGVIDIDGDLVVSDDKTLYGTFLITGSDAVMNVGAEDYTGAGATVSGPINVASAAFINVYPGSDITEAKINWDIATDSSKAIYTSVYIEDILYVTTFTNAGATVKLVESSVTKYDVIPGLDISGSLTTAKDSDSSLYKYWFVDDDATQNLKISRAYVGVFEAVYFYPAASYVYGTVTVGTGIDLYVDGKNYEPQSYYGQEDKFTVGAHTVYVQIKSGYTGDNVTIKFNGVVVPTTATGGVFLITADMDTFLLVADGATPYTPEPTPEPEKESEWTITTILLCVLVVLIAIMAVIVALRLNRN